MNMIIHFSPINSILLCINYPQRDFCVILFFPDHSDLDRVKVKVKYIT